MANRKKRLFSAEQYINNHLWVPAFGYHPTKKAAISAIEEAGKKSATHIFARVVEIDTQTGLTIGEPYTIAA
jgi:hypothetical protein